MSDISTNAISYDDWRSAAQKALGNRDIESLTKNTDDNIAVKPLYDGSINREQAQLPSGAWQINQAINHPNIAEAKQHIAQDLEQGVNSLSLYSDQSLSANGYGVNLISVNLGELFDDVFLEMVSLRLETGLDEFATANLVETYFTENNYFEKNATLSLGVDPIGKMAQFGGITTPVQSFKAEVVKLLKNSKATYILRADGRIAHNAGASEAQELSFVLSSALAYLEWADEAGLNLETVASKIELCVSTTQNQFLSIAKIRALRNLWAETLDALEIPQMAANIYAETSFRMVTKRDPWVNILRNSVACFAAGLGGANQIGILPLSAAIGLAPSFDRRISRHIQTILIEESHLADITDPSFGSGYVETITQEIAQKSWQLMQQTQQASGIIECLKSGDYQTDIANITKNRDTQLANRKLPLTGSSEFPNLDEVDYQCLEIPKHVVETPRFLSDFAALTPKRDAEMFETLRDKSDIIYTQTGKRPSIFIAKIGEAKDYLARSTFAKNFFEVGGIEAIEGQAGDDLATIIEDYKQSGSEFAIISSADSLYEKHAFALAQGLKQAGVKYLYLAGKPNKVLLADYENSALDAYIFAKSNLVETLNSLYNVIDMEAK